MSGDRKPQAAAFAVGSVQFFAQRCAERLTASGATVRFMRECLYPVVQVDVALRERCKDRMSDLDLTLLRLLGSGIGTVEALSYLTGLARHRLAPRLAPLDAQGLLKIDPAGRHRLTELGVISRDSGCMTTQSVRGMLLCGLSGRPLPAAAYDLPRHALADLREKRYLPRSLLDNQSSLPLRHLDLRSIENKKRVNLPDEVTDVLGVVAGSAQLVFLEGLLCLSVDADGEPRTRFALPCDNGFLDGLPAEQLLSLLEPLGFGLRADPDAVLQAIAGHYSGMELAVAEASIDQDGNPQLQLGASDRADLRAAGWVTHALLSSIGTVRHRPIALHRLDLAWSGRAYKVDVLAGRALHLTAAPGGRLEACADAVRGLRAMERALRRRRDAVDVDSTLATVRAQAPSLAMSDLQVLARRCRFDEALAAIGCAIKDEFANVPAEA